MSYLVYAIKLVAALAVMIALPVAVLYYLYNYSSFDLLDHAVEVGFALIAYAVLADILLFRTIIGSARGLGVTRAAVIVVFILIALQFGPTLALQHLR